MRCVLMRAWPTATARPTSPHTPLATQVLLAVTHKSVASTTSVLRGRQTQAFTAHTPPRTETVCVLPRLLLQARIFAPSSIRFVAASPHHTPTALTISLPLTLETVMKKETHRRVGSTISASQLPTTQASTVRTPLKREAQRVLPTPQVLIHQFPVSMFSLTPT